MKLTFQAHGQKGVWSWVSFSSQNVLHRLRHNQALSKPCVGCVGNNFLCILVATELPRFKLKDARTSLAWADIGSNLSRSSPPHFQRILWTAWKGVAPLLRNPHPEHHRTSLPGGPPKIGRAESREVMDAWHQAIDAASDKLWPYLISHFQSVFVPLQQGCMNSWWTLHSWNLGRGSWLWRRSCFVLVWALSWLSCHARATLILTCQGRQRELEFKASDVELTIDAMIGMLDWWADKDFRHKFSHIDCDERGSWRLNRLHRFSWLGWKLEPLTSPLVDGVDGWIFRLRSWVW